MVLHVIVWVLANIRGLFYWACAARVDPAPHGSSIVTCNGTLMGLQVE